MDYKRIYDSIVEKRKTIPVVGYSENHHIVPRALGGADHATNMVRLTAREHFICHLLLTKMYPVGSKEYHRMVRAFIMMLTCSSGVQDRHRSSRRYSMLREQLSKQMSEKQSGQNNQCYGTVWINNPERQQSRRVAAGSAIPEGWVLGRVVKWDKAKAKVAEAKAEAKRVLIERYSTWYQLYVDHGFQRFCELTGYDKSQVALVNGFKRYVSEYSPQRGKRRGK